MQGQTFSDFKCGGMTKQKYNMPEGFLGPKCMGMLGQQKYEFCENHTLISSTFCKLHTLISSSFCLKDILMNC